MAGILDPDPPVGPVASPPTAPKPPAIRGVADVAATRTAVYGGILDAARAFQPVTNARHTLKLVDVDWDGDEEVSLKDQKRAILRGETLSRPLRGTWRLEDPAGTVVDERKGVVARVPRMTDRGTFVLNGVEYSLANQMRLRAGAFTRRQQNGEVETHVNVIPGRPGIGSHHVFLDPENGVFKMRVGQANLPLVPILKVLGASEQEIRGAWGDRLWADNATADGGAVEKLFARLVRRPPEGVDRRAAVRAALESAELDPEVTTRTLGAPFKNVSAPQLLAVTKRLLAVYKNEADPDDRDAMAYQTLMGPEDLFAERVKNAHRALRRNFTRASFKGKLDPVQSGALTRVIESAITGSGLGQALEEVNPLDVLDQVTRVSRLGEGGIASADVVPEESRGVQPSQLGFVDPLRSPESSKIGVDNRLATSLRKGPDGDTFAPFRDPRTGKLAYYSPRQIADKVIAFPGELDSGKRHVNAIVGGRLKPVRRGAVDLVLPEMEDAFNHLSNLIPLKGMTKGQRVMMGSRMLAQALPLEFPESPLVQSAVPFLDDRSYEEEYGKHMGAVVGGVDGVVEAVDADSVTIRDAEGERKVHQLYNNFPLNRKTFWHSTAVVTPGQAVKKGDLLARSNYTDDKGASAVGANFRVGYLPARGYNFEDANVISESAAKRLSSVHMYQHDVDWEDNVRRGKGAFVSLFPSRFDRRQVDPLDDDGVITPGTAVRPGDPLVLAARQRDRAHNQVSRSADASFADAAQTWDHEVPGVVTDVEKTKNGVVVTVKAVNPMKVGDKLSGRHGDKGVIGKILPDDEMPTDAQGRPLEVMLNPLGVITRLNPSQIVEAALGKIARLTGRPYKIKDFKHAPDMVEYALRELARHNLSDTEDLTDPASGRKIRGVFTGERFLMKLHHMSDDKAQGRSTGGYTADGSPSKGGEAGSKRVALMALNALLSHGAHAVIRDVKAVKGQENLELWSRVMRGQGLPPARIPFVNRKFFESLKAAGVNPVADGPRTRYLAMTDADVDELAGDRELKSAETVDWKGGLKPIAGGLFDPELTGGHNGNRFAKITLTEPLPNPVMEEPIRKVLGLTGKQFAAVLAGRQELRGKTGPGAVAAALAAIDLDREEAAAADKVRTARGGARDAAVVRLRYLRDSKRTGIHPADWVVTKVPVLPPAFRPVSVMAGSDRPMAADANFLYKELFDANSNLREMTGKVDDVAEERLALYGTLKAVTGLGDPVNPKNAERGVKGILAQVFGSSPKFGVVQRKLLGTTVDLVGRAVITPDPDLDLDSVAIPEDKAWSVYKPFIVRRLARAGSDPVRALRAVRDRTPDARTALLAEMDERPVLIDRAPTLHRYGVMAFRPRLAAGSSMKVNPLVVKGFGADFDGDQMNFQVPASDDAVADAYEKMLPSKNLFAVKNFKVHQLPANEFLTGLYQATAHVDNRRPEAVFRTHKDMEAAFKAGRIDADTRVAILED